MRDYPAAELQRDYQLMLLIRQFEEALADQFAAGLIPGTSHFCIGQEACATGAVAALQADDLVSSNHRGHGHFIARGADPGRLMAELMGKASGYSGGRGGSQHMADFSLGFLGSNGITGGMIPIATGAALSQQQLGTGRVVLCFLGDGACGTGAFHEALGMASIWQLPIVYLIENNGYAMSTSTAEAFNIPHLALRAAAYGLPGVTIDGNDYFTVRKEVSAAAARAREGGGASVVEALTYRYCGHSKSDQGEYRPPGELERWQQRDPLQLMRRALVERGIWGDDDEQSAGDKVAGEVAAAVEFARQSPEPDPATAARGVWSNDCQGGS
jgi:TPP-dependent pyruvate/acetoin dehydrogenase alpha subunit